MCPHPTLPRSLPLPLLLLRLLYISRVVGGLFLRVCLRLALPRVLLPLHLSSEGNDLLCGLSALLDLVSPQSNTRWKHAYYIVSRLKRMYNVLQLSLGASRKWIRWQSLHSAAWRAPAARHNGASEIAQHRWHSLLRGTTVNRTYGIIYTQKPMYLTIFTDNIWPY